MDNHFDTIIWGPSLTGIQKAIELKRKGQKVLLAGKFGFPGGKATESLASLFRLQDLNGSGFYKRFFEEVKQLQHSVLFRNQYWVLLHPEAVKRVCWEMLAAEDIDLLFHVVPLDVGYKHDLFELQLFGKEGEIMLTAGDVIDESNDWLLSKMKGKTGYQNLQINAFFSGSLPFDMSGFHVTRRLQTSIGTYFSTSVKHVPNKDVEKTFNRELDRLSKETWKMSGARILMVPVFPEITAVK
ncbi:MAG: FAD-dependent oxidoreductase [Bacteroidales bacterium]